LLFEVYVRQPGTGILGGSERFWLPKQPHELDQ
jgi:hypothetical protein